ncbi:MAG: hypothetical protein M3Z10_13650 [Gemmatimonadota bacterium]|nr:hypothetical protein [Gemmatimonadota bacterium]
MMSRRVTLAAVVQHIQHLEDSELVRTEKVAASAPATSGPRGCDRRSSGSPSDERSESDGSTDWAARARSSSSRSRTCSLDGLDHPAQREEGTRELLDTLGELLNRQG